MPKIVPKYNQGQSTMGIGKRSRFWLHCWGHLFFLLTKKLLGHPIFRLFALHDEGYSRNALCVL